MSFCRQQNAFSYKLSMQGIGTVAIAGPSSSYLLILECSSCEHWFKPIGCWVAKLG